MCLQKHLIWASYTTLFCRKVSCHYFVPFVDPVLKLCIYYYESSVRSRGGVRGAPLIVTLNCCTKDWKKFLDTTPPPPLLISWSGWPGPSLIWRSGSASGIHAFLDSKIQIWIFLAKKCTLRFNPLNLNSDQQQSSPNNVNTWLRKKVMRIINKMISLGKLL